MITANMLYSCSSFRPAGQPRGPSKCYTGPCWRYLFCYSSRGDQGADVPPNLRLPAGSLGQALASTRLEYFHWSNYSLWLRLVPFWLARPRKGHPLDHHSFQLDCSKGSPPLLCLPPPCSRRTCLALPVALYTRRVSSKDCLYNLLAHPLPIHFRPHRASP